MDDTQTVKIRLGIFRHEAVGRNVAHNGLILAIHELLHRALRKFFVKSQCSLLSSKLAHLPIDCFGGGLSVNFILELSRL
jgi:hypothetical protein